MKFSPPKPYFLGETLESLQEKMKAAGEPAFRAAQVTDWVYKKLVTEPRKMTNLPEKTQQWLEDSFCFRPATRQLIKGDPDTTQKLLLKMEDGSLIETVLIKAPCSAAGGMPQSAPLPAAFDFGETFPTEGTRRTVCISTQVGCAYGCKFCASGLMGWKRDLLAGEIVGELFHIIQLVNEENKRRAQDGNELTNFIDNIVVMGMGEPLSNFENVMRALTIVNAPWGFNFGARRITVSTSGLVPRIRELAEMPAQFRLAISLHGATNEVREKIMPVNKKHPLEELIEAARYYNQKHNRMLTFEYILIDGLNDTFEQAAALIKICEGMKAHVNCIPYNKVEGLPWKRPSIMRQQAFVKKLRDAGVSVTIRREKGHKIEAACGQLRLQEEKKLVG